MNEATMPSHDNDELYFFMKNSRFDYAQQQFDKRIERQEYTSVNYFVQAQNLDKAIAAQLLAKTEYNWGELEDQPLTWTTEDFKAVALTLNAENLRRFNEEVGDTLE